MPVRTCVDGPASTRRQSLAGAPEPDRGYSGSGAETSRLSARRIPRALLRRPAAAIPVVGACSPIASEGGFLRVARGWCGGDRRSPKPQAAQSAIGAPGRGGASSAEHSRWSCRGGRTNPAELRAVTKRYATKRDATKPARGGTPRTCATHQGDAAEPGTGQVPTRITVWGAANIRSTSQRHRGTKRPHFETARHETTRNRDAATAGTARPRHRAQAHPDPEAAPGAPPAAAGRGDLGTA